MTSTNKQYHVWEYDQEQRTLRMLLWKVIRTAARNQDGSHYSVQMPATWNTRSAGQAYADKHLQREFKVLLCECGPGTGMQHERRD